MTQRWSVLAALAVAGAALAGPAAGQAVFRNEAAGGASFSVPVMNWRDIPFRTVVRQQYDFSCGSAAVATLLTYQYGRKTSEADAFKAMYAAGDQAKIRKVGFSMLDMKTYLASQGFPADGYRMTLAELEQAGAPAIVLLVDGRYRHFVVIKGVSGGKVLVGDPARGLKIYAAPEFTRMWNGIVFSVHDAPVRRVAFNRPDEWRPWSSAPLSMGAAPLSAEMLTRELAPIYQFTPPQPPLPMGAL